MALEVQNYLRGGRTLDDLASEFFVKARVNESLGVVALNYNQIASPMHEIICQECRALILELGTWRVVSRAWNKFFNFGEPLAAPVDWATARVQQKVDGSLVCLFFHRGEWHCATKGTPDASGPVGDRGMTFRDLIRAAMTDTGCPWDRFTSCLSPARFYAFELTAPENQVIVAHAMRGLTWLGVWDAREGTELDIRAETICDAAPRVPEFPLGGLEDCLAACAVLPPLEAEGYVAVDAAWNRVKIKSPAYVMADRQMSRLVSDRRRVELCLSPSCDDILPALPAFRREEIVALSERIRRVGAEVAAAYEGVRALPTRKDFALAVKSDPRAAMLFRLHDGKSLEVVMRELRPEAWCRLLGLRDEQELEAE